MNRVECSEVRRPDATRRIENGVIDCNQVESRQYAFRQPSGRCSDPRRRPDELGPDKCTRNAPVPPRELSPQRRRFRLRNDELDQC